MFKTFEAFGFGGKKVLLLLYFGATVLLNVVG